MKDKISALMDGELFEDETEIVLDKVKRDEHTHQDWKAYHLIGDVLRQPDYIHRDISAKVSVAMRNEPTVLAPRGSAMKQKAQMFALSAAASLLALAVVAWTTVQISPETSTQLAMRQTTVQPANSQLQVRSNDYLLAHQEFSPSTDMYGRATYIRAANFSSEDK
jgi:sigma-E factor negative regulatory protein RseA